MTPLVGELRIQLLINRVRWDGTENNRIPTREQAPAPVPRRHIIGLPAGHLKDASGAADAAGLRPVLDLPRPLATDMAANGKQQTASHACPAEHHKHA